MRNQLYIGGGEDPKKPLASLSYDQINRWSNYVENNQNKKWFNDLWKGFVSANPKSGISPEALQRDLELLNASTRRNAAQNNSEFVESANTGYSFPRMTYNGQDYGRVNGLMQTQIPIPTQRQAYPEKLIAKQLPSGVTNIWFDDSKGLVAYEDPYEGVIKYADKSVLNSPEAKRLNVK